MTFNPNIPNPTDNLSQSQSQFKTNNGALDNVFGVDHYKFSDSSGNAGFHNVVTTPAFIDNPPTGLPPSTTTNPKLYSFQQYANLGVLQYSRGTSNAIPTPITSLQSPSTPIILAPSATTNVLDFTGISRAIVQLFAANFSSPFQVFSNTIYWNGTVFLNLPLGSPLQALASGNILQLKNSVGPQMNNVYWTLDLKRVE